MLLTAPSTQNSESPHVGSSIEHQHLRHRGPSQRDAFACLAHAVSLRIPGTAQTPFCSLQESSPGPTFPATKQQPLRRG